MFEDPANLRHPHYQANRAVLGGIMIKAGLAKRRRIRCTGSEKRLGDRIQANYLLLGRSVGPYRNLSTRLANNPSRKR